MTRPSDISPETWERADILRDQFQAIKDDTEFVARIIMTLGQGAATEAQGLTHEQAKALDFIRAYQAANSGASPSYAEIGAAVCRSKGNVHDLVTRMVNRGVLVRSPKLARSLTIVSISHVNAAHKFSELGN